VFIILTFLNSHIQLLFFLFYLFLNAVLLRVLAEKFLGAKETPRLRNSSYKPWWGAYFWEGGGGQNRKCQIDGIFIEFGPCFCPRIKRSLKKEEKRSSLDLDRFFVTEASVL